MTNTYKFNYTYKGKNKTKVIVTDSLENAIEKGELFLEELNDELNLFDLDSWEDVQDECEKYNIYVDDLIEEFE